MPTITVLTPVHEGGYACIRELHDCLRGQRLPAHWQLEWVVQEDGRTRTPLEAVPDAPWISKGAGRWGGAAQARTLGLARATGTLLRCADAHTWEHHDRAIAAGHPAAIRYEEMPVPDRWSAPMKDRLAWAR
ncbi:hypothetical protein GCM10009801_10770 [Streptomyces albiaxialis]|uniref:Uncharacterized protein n=1 Tax=Streptomyces albiaxialis TaxID=329523 RepID=A0ABN2VLZ8_9ACTN